MTTEVTATGDGRGGSGRPAGAEAEVLRVLATDGTPIGDEPAPSVDDALALHEALLRGQAVWAAVEQRAATGTVAMPQRGGQARASAIGAVTALREGDWLFPEGGELGAFLQRGMPLERLADQLLGSNRDVALGRQSPGSISFRRAGIASASACLGTHLIHAVGWAWAAQLRGDAGVALASFGAAARASADFHNALNFAGVFGVPAVLFCAHEGPEGPALPSGDVSEAGVAYGVPAVRCDRDDALAVARASAEAVARAHAGQGPTLVEALGHGGDPVDRLRRYLESAGRWDDEADRELRARLAAEVEDAFEAAAERPAPAPESLTEDVFSQTTQHLREQQRALAER